MWLLFAVIVIIFSEVILGLSRILLGSIFLYCFFDCFSSNKTEDEAKSACEGRVEANNDQLEEDTRTLAIVCSFLFLSFFLCIYLDFNRHINQ